MRVGLLPLYLELYDRTDPHVRPGIEQFYKTIAQNLEERGLEVLTVPVCRLRDEFADAVKQFENEGAALIITLHLAYSPSLECIDALAGTPLGLVVLDTTEAYAFGPSADDAGIMYNHGIHGVQDMCNLLNRRAKEFEIFAGHYEESDVLERVAACCRGYEIAGNFKNSRVGIVGTPFEGMGDFQVPFGILKEEFGIEVVKYEDAAAREALLRITAGEIASERIADEAEFLWDDSVTDELYERTARTGLALRNWIDDTRLDALTINFLEAAYDSGLPVMPFIECGKAMARGTGYAGEGDVLTAALCGAILRVYPLSTFTEMFCPDWRGGSVFLSHMGEMNYRVSAQKPLLTEMEFPYTSALNPAVAYATLMPGKAVLINLAPGGDGKYTLIIAPGEVLAVKWENKLARSVNGWFKPGTSLPEFLERFSIAGGTHHSVLCYGDCLDAMVSFANVMRFECIVLS